MIYEKLLIKAYENITKSRVEAITKKIVRIVIIKLQSYKRDSGMLQSPDDCILCNFWDEICVQAQEEEFVFWSVYEDFILNTVSEVMSGKFVEYDLKMIWLQTDEYWEWSDCEFEDEEDLSKYFDNDGFPNAYNKNDVVNYLYHLILNEAANYSNARIEKYIFGDIYDE